MHWWHSALRCNGDKLRSGYFLPALVTNVCFVLAEQVTALSFVSNKRHEVGLDFSYLHVVGQKTTVILT